MSGMNEAELIRIKNEAGNQIKAILQELESKVPGVTEGLAAAMGSAVGGAASFAALTTLGTAGLSAAGITSGLATAGAVVGGGMVAGIGVLAAPVAVLGVLGYGLAKRYKQNKITAALTTAIEKLYSVQHRLMQNAEYFKDELAGIKATIEMLKRKQKA